MVKDLLCINQPCFLAYKPNRFTVRRDVPGAAAMASKVSCSVSAQNSQLTVNRRSANYKPSTWDYERLQSLKSSDKAAELERGETASAILCYMQETGLSEEITREHLRNMIDKTWKNMNKDRVLEHPFAELFVETALNLARIAQCTYQYGDGHGAPDDRAKKRVLSIIVEPISFMERKDAIPTYN